MHKAVDLDEFCSGSPPDLKILISYLYDAAKGLSYIHANDVVHCDVKPANIFVTSEPDKSEPAKAILADFGYAKNIRSQEGLTTIGFTDIFAHPNLQDGSVFTNQQSRTFTKIRRELVKKSFDLFAFGMTISYLLDKFYNKYSVYKKYSYEIKFLKLCSARLLDGLNHQRPVKYGNLPPHCYRDIGKFGSEGFVAGIKYRSAAEFTDDLAKLLGKCSILYEVPELITSRNENIQVSYQAPVIYTQRLKKIIEHPIVKRLGSVTQLGLLSLVYPGATHTRIEHSLGAMGFACRYIESLYNDTVDPIFKQIVSTKKIKATIIAALLHDIGQYPLAHDLEDVSMDFFGHENFNEQLLGETKGQTDLFNDTDVKLGKFSKELDQILKDLWEIELTDVINVLGAKSSDRQRPKQRGGHADRVCKSIIDGPLDCDKIDYLIRDSRHCNVRYGYGIDSMRLIRNLSVASVDISDGHLLLVVGVNEKARVSAESILFARYAMLNNVYWQHTMRSIKSLLHLAAAEMLSATQQKNIPLLKEDFFSWIFLKNRNAPEGWQEVVERSNSVDSIQREDLSTLCWLWKNTNEIGKSALEYILNRKLFKRILTLYRIELTEKERNALEKVFKPEMYKDRCLLRINIEKALISALNNASISKELLETEGYTESEWKRRLENQQLLRCIIDFPSNRAIASFGLQVVRQWGERPSQREPSSSHTSPLPNVIPGDNFRDGMKELEKQVSCFRAFWHPDEYKVLTETIGEESISNIIREEIKKYIPLE